MRKLTKVIAAGAVAVLVGLTGTYGYFSDTLKVNNHISLGDINIGLKEYQKKGSAVVPYTGSRTVVPGETISKIPKITNYAKPCWVRARIIYENSRENMEGLSDVQLQGIPGGWVKRGQYYYYTKILNRKDSIHLFEKLTVPQNWTEEHTGQKLGIIVQADAIQAANFTPDFSGMSPWGNQKIQLCVHEQDGATLCRMPKTRLSVEFNGKAHKLLAVPGDFFSNFGTAMPGDEFEDTVTVSNTTDKKAEIFFRTAVQGQESDQMELLKGIALSVSMNGKTLYQGTLDSPGLKKDQSLGVFEPDEKGELHFKLSVPSEWDNSYALRKADVQWIFTVNEDEAAKSQKNPEEKNKVLSHDSESEKAVVKTGDSSGTEAAILLLLLSGGAVLAVLVIRISKKGGQQE